MDELNDPHRRQPVVCFQQMDAPRPQRNRIHLDVWLPHDQAEARVGAAVAADGRVVNDEMAPSWWVLADPEGNEACVATWIGTDGAAPATREARLGVRMATRTSHPSAMG